MSLNLHLKVIYNGREEKIDLIQTPTIVSQAIYGSGNPWQEVLKKYLAWIKTQHGTNLYKNEKNRLGKLWREVEKYNGRMIFEVW